MTANMHNLVLLCARILFSEIFIFSGISKIMGFDATLAYMQSAGVNWHPIGLEIIAIILELGGGLLVLLGWHTRLGAAAVFLFTLLTTFLIHHFWSYSADAAQLQMIMFMKNLTIMGGALYIFAFGAGAYSVDKK
ncbi:MAG: DoxX family protein [Legionellales bacterium]|jgi:putative oxidoreductase